MRNQKLKKLKRLNSIKNILMIVLTIVIVYISIKYNSIIKDIESKYQQEYQELTTNNKQLENKIQELNLEIENLHRYKEIYEKITSIDISSRTETRYYDIPLTASQQEFVQAVVEENGFGETYIYGLMQLESGFDVNAASSSSYGIMQVNGEYADFYAELAGLKEYDLFNFEDNVRIGIACLKYIREYYISIGIDSQEELSKLILTAYNRGIKGTEKHIKKYGQIVSRYGDIVMLNKIKIEQKLKEKGDS